jgi:hypothetical protein
MATKLTTKRVIRETSELYRGRPLMIAISAEGIDIWQKNRQQHYKLSVVNALEAAASLMAAAENARRAAEGKRPLRRRRV